jgi:hypothetical protein
VQLFHNLLMLKQIQDLFATKLRPGGRKAAAAPLYLPYWRATVNGVLHHKHHPHAQFRQRGDALDGEGAALLQADQRQNPTLHFDFRCGGFPLPWRHMRPTNSRPRNPLLSPVRSCHGEAPPWSGGILSGRPCPGCHTGSCKPVRPVDVDLGP